MDEYPFNVSFDYLRGRGAVLSVSMIQSILSLHKNSICSILAVWT